MLGGSWMKTKDCLTSRSNNDRYVNRVDRRCTFSVYGRKFEVTTDNVKAKNTKMSSSR
jgi:hypothetical protein